MLAQRRVTAPVGGRIAGDSDAPVAIVREMGRFESLRSRGHSLLLALFALSMGTLKETRFSFIGILSVSAAIQQRAQKFLAGYHCFVDPNGIW